MNGRNSDRSVNIAFEIDFVIGIFPKLNMERTRLFREL